MYVTAMISLAERKFSMEKCGEAGEHQRSLGIDVEAEISMGKGSEILTEEEREGSNKESRQGSDSRKSEFEVEVEVEMEESFGEEEEEEEEEDKEIGENVEYKVWQDVNLAETAREIMLPITFSEEPLEEIFRPCRKETDQKKVFIKKGKYIQEGLFGVSSYYIYEITSFLDKNECKVNRRYKDFEWLHSSLKENYKGMSIPPLPSKQISLFRNGKLDEKRRSQLEKCLTILLKHYILKNSKQLTIFLTCNDIEFQKVKATMKSLPISFKYNDLEDAIDQIISKIQSKMNLIFSLRILPFSQDLASIDRYLARLQVPMYSLSTAFGLVVDYQERSNSILESMHFAHSNYFYRTMQLHKHLIHASDIESLSLTSELNEENLKIEALRGAVDDYKDALRKYYELEALVERKIFKSRNTIYDAEKYIKDIEGIKLEISTVEKSIVEIENNIKSEKIWFQAERDEHLESIVSSIFSLYKEKLSKEQDFWLEKKHEIS